MVTVIMKVISIKLFHFYIKYNNPSSNYFYHMMYRGNIK